MKTIRLKLGKERSLQRRHPWVFDSAIAKGSGDSGGTVRVESYEGQFLAGRQSTPRWSVARAHVAFNGVDENRASFLDADVNASLCQFLRTCSQSRRQG
ncbi:hypothetical protein [Acidovorax sp.]|uniref:hypothetical protein n=1 Tax=Acidovorax sp. TaxID=1872122 RepID=UPI003BB1E96B